MGFLGNRSTTQVVNPRARPKYSPEPIPFTIAADCSLKASALQKPDIRTLAAKETAGKEDTGRKTFERLADTKLPECAGFSFACKERKTAYSQAM
jgi:hypothetical protein